jgi:hypothetical protein
LVMPGSSSTPRRQGAKTVDPSAHHEFVGRQIDDAAFAAWHAGAGVLQPIPA